MAEQVVTELSIRGEKIVAALRTAAVLIEKTVEDDTGLRFAESAVYNLREALDAVVTGRTPVPGGLPVVITAWERFEREVAQPGNDSAASLDVFGAVLRDAAERKDRNSYHEARLIAYFRDKSGLDPLFDGLGPVAEYRRLRKATSQGLHQDSAMESATELYERTLAWFVRLFTPPAAVVQRLRALAAESWQGEHQVDCLRELASNPHHLRLFFTHLADPAWLTPLYDADAVPMPDLESPWPVTGLSEGLARTNPAAVAALTQRLLRDSKQLQDGARLNARFNMLILATKLGPHGYTIIGDIVTAHPDNRSMRSLATSVVKQADPSDPIVERVGNTVLNGDAWDRDSYHYRALLDRLESGMTRENVQKRTRMVVAKLRNAAERHGAGWVALGIARLTTELGEDDRRFLVIISHYLARLLLRAHTLGVPGTQLLTWIAPIPSEIGERLVCRVLTIADDVPLHDKIDHITRRLSSQTATGDDHDLVQAVLAANPDPTQLTVWTDTLGSPSAAPADPGVPPGDWEKAWRWSAILPGHLLTQWQTPIATVSAKHGLMTPEAFDHRIPVSFSTWSQSAYSADELTDLPALDAARMTARWRPDAEEHHRLIGARELARTLQTVVTSDPLAWTEDPLAMVKALREPVYVLHYFRALAEKAVDLVSRTDGIIAAAALAKSARWTPTVLGDNKFDYEPDWQHVEAATVDLIAALANHDAPFTQHLDTVWSWALATLDMPTDPDYSTASDPLDRAINNLRGRGLQAVLSLADWEYRNAPVIRPQFFTTLDQLLQVTGSVGMEYRAIIAWQRLRLERIAQDWLDQRFDSLFHETTAGPATVDLTLKYGRYITPWLLQTLRNDIIAAALRGAENATVSLLLGTLQGQAGYETDAIIQALKKNSSALANAAEDIAHLVENSNTDAPDLAVAVEFWQTLIDAKRSAVPTEVLHRTGRWAFVTNLQDSVWAPLMLRTLTYTDGSIDYAIEVADRCETVPVPGTSTKILLLLQSRGEPWEQHHIANVALNALRTLSTTRFDENFTALQTKLIERGYDHAAGLHPYEDPP
nr:hypothetical protein [Kibdelosporangium sp. MJ126-NF4]